MIPGLGSTRRAKSWRKMRDTLRDAIGPRLDIARQYAVYQNDLANVRKTKLILLRLEMENINKHKDRSMHQCIR